MGKFISKMFHFNADVVRTFGIGTVSTSNKLIKKLVMKSQCEPIKFYLF